MKIPRPITLTDVVCTYGFDQCERCENIYANYLEMIRVCFKCHKTMCEICCPENICPSCLKKINV